ncbi:MAG TPA: DNA ligase, partial [Bacteroidia bacterium]|nr:DNA ligase [Bacteroidia bacterium]
MATTTKKAVRKKNSASIKSSLVIKNKSAIQSNSSKSDVASILETAPKTKFPKDLTPMLATLVDKPFDQSGWIYEVKWDGYRALGFINKGKVELKSRNNKSFNDK